MPRFHVELDDPYELNGEQRTLGMVICRGTTIMTVNPVEGMTEIQNPYEMSFVYSHKHSHSFASLEC